MDRLQSASTYEKFMIEIANIMDLDDVMHYEIIIYIMKTHPRHWTVFGNRHDISDASWNGLYEDYLLIMMVNAGCIQNNDIDLFPKEKLYDGNLPHEKKFKM